MYLYGSCHIYIDNIYTRKLPVQRSSLSQWPELVLDKDHCGGIR